jgi:hypothetical protein
MRAGSWASIFPPAAGGFERGILGFTSAVFTVSLDEVPSMKRSMCGIVVLAAATGLWSCNGDPTGDFVETGVEIVPDPSSVFIDQGASKFVLVEATDQQGNQLAADFQAQNVGAGITVEKDTTFLQTTIGTHLETSARFIVTGVGPGSTSFDVVGAGATAAVAVRVVPTSFAATFSNAAPAANEPVTITLPAGYRFIAGASVATDQGPGVVQSFSADSTALTVLLAPGSTGPVSLDSVQATFLPGVTLAGVPTDATVTVGAVVPQAGTGAPGTAPAVTIQAVGGSTVFFDGGTYDYPAPILAGAFGNFPARLYKFTVAAPTTLTVTLNWPSPEDLGIYYFLANGTTETAAPADGASAPESGTNTFVAGTYLIAIVNFAATNPAWFSLSVTTEPPAAP